MYRLRILGLVVPLVAGACSLINAPADPIEGAGGGGTGGTGGSTGGTGGTGGGMMTTTSQGGGTTTEDCGDGVKAPDEECDDGNTISGDGCDLNCTSTACGNNVVTNNEECDDGNTTDGDGCDSNCTSTGCGNGIVTMGEQCDDGGFTDPDPPPGNQDPCTSTCNSKEIDIETGPDGSDLVNERPALGYRRDNDNPSFYALWHHANTDIVRGREYKFDGQPKAMMALDVSTSPDPDAAGHLLCTASSNRSLFVWRDTTDNKLHTRKVDSDGTVNDKVALQFPAAVEAGMSCAAADSTNLVIAAMAKGAGPLYDVLVQGFSSGAAPQGLPLDIGDALSPSKTAAWSIANGFLVAWVADPSNDMSGIAAQQLMETGEPQAGFVFQMSASGDVAPREPAGTRLGAQSQFAITYSRLSPPDPMGMTHREIVLRIFQSPSNGGMPIVVSTAATDQREPVIAASPATGKLVVAWTGPAAGGAEDIFFRVYNAMGLPQSDVLTANDIAAGEQTWPAVVVDPPTGDVAMAWETFIPNTATPRKITGKMFPGLLK